MATVRDAAIPVECSLFIKREGKDGWVVGFAVHPDQMPEDLLRMRMGARVMLVAVEIDDNETPKPTYTGKEVTFGSNTDPSTERDDAVMHAGMLCRKTSFQIWCHVPIEKTLHDLHEANEISADFIRKHCKIRSRSQLRTNKAARKKFWSMVDRYQEETQPLESPSDKDITLDD